MRGLLLLTLFLMGISARSLAVETFISTKQLNLDGQGGWSYFSGADAPNGGYLGHLSAGVTSIQAKVVLPAAIPAGRHDFYIRVTDYDYYGEVTLSAAGVSARAVTSDRDANRNWTGPISLTLPSATDAFTMTFHKLKSASTPTKCLLTAFYVTSDTSLLLFRNGDAISFDYPAPADYDNSPPIKGNLLSNSSFEVGLGRGWGLAGPRRPATLAEMWDPAVGYHGSGSVKFDIPKGSAWFELISRPMHLAPNKRHTLTAYVRSTGRNWANILLRNTIQPPAGYPAPQILKAGFLTSGANTWQRIVLTDVLLEYPDSEFQIVLWAQAYDGGAVWFDAIQLEEGDPSPYELNSSVEVGLQSSVPGNLFYEGTPVIMDLRVHNAAATTVTTNVAFEIYDYSNQLLREGTVPVTTAGLTTSSQPLDVATGLRGIFRTKIYIPGARDSEEEIVFSIIPKPAIAGRDTTSLVGTHLYSGEWEGKLMERLGIKWNRALSPAAWFRWSLAEPAEKAFIWHDSDVLAATRNGITLMANIGEHAPAWAHRHFFGLSGVNGSFRPGETVLASSGGSGTVTVVLGVAHATGHALQLTAVNGTLAQGQTLRGSVSGATATISTPVYPTTPDLDKWEAYVGAVVTHFKNSVKHWEIWNEPNQDTSEMPAPGGIPSFYAEILRRAMIKIKQVDPSAEVIGMGGIYSPDWALKVINLLPENWRDYISALSIHLYPGNGALADNFRTRISEPYNIPIWNTESGSWDLGFYLGKNANVRHGIRNLQSFKDADRFYRGTVLEAENVAINFLQSIGGGLTRYFYYDARTVSSPSFFNTHPTMIDFDDSIKAKGIAFGILGSFIDHSKGLGRLHVSESQVEVYLFDKSGVPMAALFSTDGAHRWVDLSSQIAGGGVRAYNLMGNPETLVGSKIPVGRSPILLVGQGITVNSLRSALGAASISPRADTRAPALSITHGPRGPVYMEDTIHMRWLALDDCDIPSEADPDATQYSFRLVGRDQTWSNWSQLTWIDLQGLESNRYVFEVRAKDRSGNQSLVRSREINVFAGRPAAPRNFRVAR